jgi:hypothetical protein
MARKGGGARRHGNKNSASVTIDPELYDWVKARVGHDKPFASLSHAVGRGLAKLRDSGEFD